MNIKEKSTLVTGRDSGSAGLSPNNRADIAIVDDVRPIIEGKS